MIIMPSKSTFNHYNLTGHNASKKTTNVSQFFGVEYLNSQLETKDYHATDIKNIVYKDKTNQKRSGYEQVAKTPNVEGIDIRRNAVNGYYEFYDENSIFHKIIHIGTRLFEVKFLEKDSYYWETKFNLISNNMANHKSMAFSSKGILYILDGTKYRYLRVTGGDSEYTFTLNDVANSDIVYIPTTSLIGADDTISAYEDVNMLTNWRKNELDGTKFIENNEENDYYYELDSPIDELCIWEMVLNINYQKYYPAVVSSDAFTRDSDGNLVHIYYFVQSSKRTQNAINGSYEYSGSNINEDAVARLMIWTTNDYNSKIKIFNNENFISSVKNDIVLPFVAYSSSTNNNPINKCTFGVVYNDRLFVSGNPLQQNTDWHTQPITNYGNDETYGDFTYFSDLDYCNYGSDNTSVVGYDIFSDGNLIVFKEPSRFEPTIYRRYKELKVATSYTGEQVSTQKENETYYEEGYPCFPINTMGGEGAIKNCSIANFLGNTLVLTKSGLKKLFTRQNTYNSERILVDVSSNINLAITKEDLTNAFLFTFKDKLILQIGDITYVAYDSLKEDNEYEWYKLEGIKADIFFEIDNELYFSDIDGNICRFNDGKYVFKDKDRIYTALGSSMPNNNEITINNNYRDKVSDGDKVLVVEHFSNDIERPMYYKIGGFCSQFYPSPQNFTGVIVSNKIVLNDYNDNFYDGCEIYANGDEINGSYTLEEIEDSGQLEFYIKSQNGYIDISNSVGFNIYISTEKKELVVANYDEENLTFNLKNELGESVEFYTTNAAESYYCIITHDKNVEAYYKTKPYDMGSIGYDKTIWQYTIANDTNLKSVIDLGYLANRKQGITGFAKGSKGLNFEAYNFSEISFLNDGLPHIYTKYRMIPNVNFIKFEFRNLFDSNMVLSQLSFVYTVSGQVRGSK